MDLRIFWVLLVNVLFWATPYLILFTAFGLFFFLQYLGVDEDVLDALGNRMDILISGMTIICMVALSILSWKLGRRAVELPEAKGLKTTREVLKWLGFGSVLVTIVVMVLPEDSLPILVVAIAPVMMFYCMIAFIELRSSGRTRNNRPARTDEEQAVVTQLLQTPSPHGNANQTGGSLQCFWCSSIAMLSGCLVRATETGVVVLSDMKDEYLVKFRILCCAGLSTVAWDHW